MATSKSTVRKQRRYFRRPGPGGSSRSGGWILGRVGMLWIGVGLRVGWLMYGLYQDANLPVPYTDIDYSVFSDAAARICDGFGSPYDRATYRYTPLLAYVLTPNCLFPHWGKIVFAAADVLTGYIMSLILEHIHWDTRYAALWTFNPFVMTISTRGNAESIIALLMMTSLYMVLVEKCIWKAAVMYGLVVHMKIFPIIYAPTYLTLLDPTYESLLTTHKLTIKASVLRQRRAPQSRFSAFISTLRKCVTTSRIIFTLISASVFLYLALVFYVIYGWKFIHETYLYHIVRLDHRHNFSLYSYHMYLTTAVAASARAWWEPIASFIPQIGLAMTLGVMFGKDIFFASFIQTMVFVTFNKVATSQYFVWYITFLPFILAQREISLRKGLFLLLIWAGSQAIWLSYAYRLEFLGESVFRELFLASLGHFVANVVVIVVLLQRHQYGRVVGLVEYGRGRAGAGK